MGKLLRTKSHDSEVPISVQCNIISLINHLQDIIAIFVVRYRQMKILKKTASFGVSNSQGAQNTESETRRCFTEILV